MGSGSRPMKPSCSCAEGVGAGAVGAGQRLPERDRRVDGGLARLDPPHAPGTRGRGRARPGRRRPRRRSPRRARSGPRASASKKPSGAWWWVFTSAVVPSLSPHPGGGGDVAAGDRRGRDHRRAEQLLGAPRDQGQPGHVRDSSRVERGDERRAGALDHAQHLLEARQPHRSTGRAPRHPVRRDRSRGRASARSPAPPTSRRLAAVHDQHQVVVVVPVGVEGPGPVAGGVVAGARSGWPRPARPSARPRASRRCRRWSPRRRPASPASASRASSTTWAIGERQMLPRQTRAIR